jgi:hypothetical protein
MSLELLHTGIPVPEFSTTVPWGISESELYSYIPASQLRGATEHSPSLLFSCLGVRAEFQFDVYTNPDGKFSGVRLCDIDSPSHSYKITDLSTKVVENLGTPHMRSNTRVQWYDDFIVVDIGNRLRRHGREWLRYAYLEICNSSHRHARRQCDRTRRIVSSTLSSCLAMSSARNRSTK